MNQLETKARHERSQQPLKQAVATQLRPHVRVDTDTTQLSPYVRVDPATSDAPSGNNQIWEGPTPLQLGDPLIIAINPSESYCSKSSQSGIGGVLLRCAPREAASLSAAEEAQADLLVRCCDPKAAAVNKNQLQS